MSKKESIKRFIQWMFWGMMPWYLLWFISKMIDSGVENLIVYAGVILITICVAVSGATLAKYFDDKN